MKKILLIFLVLLFNPMLAQNTEPNDCVNAITVCGNETIISNATGHGAKYEVNSCGGIEHNSLWLKINIVQAGTLGFDLIPLDSNINIDYDFWVYGPNKSCSSLVNADRCSTTNPAAAGLSSNITGMKDGINNTSSGPGVASTNNSYVRSLNVAPGQTYYIAIDRPHGDGGFKLVWTGTAMSGTGAFPAPPEAKQIPDLIQCSGTPNVSIFPLAAVSSQINSDTNNTITFHTTLANAVDGISPLPNVYGNTSNPQTIYARVTNNIGGCFSITSFKLKVTPVPTASISLSSTQVCSGEDVTVNFTGTPNATVDYTVNGGPIQSVLLDDTGSFLLVEPVTAPRTYALVIAKIIDGTNTQKCSSPPLTDSKTVTVKPNPTITGKLVVCLNETLQLVGSGTPAAVNPWTSSNTTIAKLASIESITANAVGTSVITYTDSNGCSASSTITVNELPTITGLSTICGHGSTQLMGSGTPAASGAWTSSDSSIATITSSGLASGVSPGTAILRYTNANGCSAEFNLDVTASSGAQNATAVVSHYFADNVTITVTVTGVGPYQFSLDGGEFQTSNVFSHVTPGLHTVKINDNQGCTDINLNDIRVVDYPRFFTPNGDGNNDTWNISLLSADQPNSEIYIFDRFGKLLTRITPAGAGWDGTYDGYSLPSDDYWFTVKYVENGLDKLFKAHFSLKR